MGLGRPDVAESVSSRTRGRPAKRSLPPPHGGGRHRRRAEAALRDRRDALVAAIEERFPRTSLALVPRGGLHLWLGLPDGLDDARVAAEAGRAGVVVSTGGALVPGGAARSLHKAQLRWRRCGSLEGWRGRPLSGHERRGHALVGRVTRWFMDRAVHSSSGTFWFSQAADQSHNAAITDLPDTL